MKPIEQHPFEPFLPNSARFLFLGTFPPRPEKWSMEFFYPNKINDMWRIMGLIFFGDRNHFWNEAERKFMIEPIKDFLTEKGIAMYDTAYKVERLKDNASDKFLKIVEPIDLLCMLGENRAIEVVVTTGEKAASVVAELTSTRVPEVGKSEDISMLGRNVRHYRMPSTSRAYPLKIEKKAEFYKNMFEAEGVRMPNFL